jgi:hypothetical protein
MISDHNVLPPAGISSVGIWSLPGDLCLFNFAIAISTSKGLGSGTNSSALCISICLTSLALCTFSNRDVIFPPIQKLWESESRSPFSFFTKLLLGW